MRVLKLDLEGYANLHKLPEDISRLRTLAAQKEVQHVAAQTCRDIANILEHMYESIMDQGFLPWTDSYKHKRMMQVKQMLAERPSTDK